ncbi:MULTISPECIES: hypothetical protein [Actinoalloteichus]|uniref:Uncharacterized protein n=1 Tax=Actinoalloteichus fjordicus TaxID=1612552 RepID=A0AAC9L765_9PSEU|nr:MULTISPECIES: hypothetical protein [Actinoalloteichus]APU12633.1 hypothetical protein UA74_02730 [Actinoalloteichus fjordicus]APU18586.1 hypothetical protein UA75_02735 [Actinoalloteichus sp. GBA129-24]
MLDSMPDTDYVVIDDIPLAGTLVESLPRVQLALAEWEEHRKRHVNSIRLEVLAEKSAAPVIRIMALTENTRADDLDAI